MKRTLQGANIIALIVTLVINYLSNTGIFNNSTMASVSRGTKTSSRRRATRSLFGA